MAAAALLAGCGGGGGAPPSVQVPTGVRTVAASPGSDLSELNYETVGAPVVRALLSTTTDELLDITGQAGQASPNSFAGARLRDAAGLTVPARLLLGAVRDAAPRVGREQAQGSQMMGPTACEGGMGSMSMAVDDADGDDRLSAGDSIVMSLSNCTVAPGMPMTSGQMTMRLEVVELDASDTPTAVEMRAHFIEFEVAGYGSMNGDMQLWSKSDAMTGSERMRLRYQAMSVVEAGQPLVYDFDVDGTATATGSSFDLSGGIGIGGQVYSIVPGSSFSQIATDPPHVGSLELRDAAGDAMRLTARSNLAFDQQFMRAGAMLAEHPGQLWSSFRLGN